jgi:hypothetical protein
MVNKGKLIEINKQLDSDEIPFELEYKIVPNIGYDVSKLQYDDYKYPEFYARRFPSGYDSIPGFDKIFEQMAIDNKDKSLFDELESRKNNNLDDINGHS